jgi:Lrp/AsnC ligand binding domain
MLKAYILLITNLENKYKIADYFAKLDNVVNVDMLCGPYDIVVEIILKTNDDLKERIEKNLTNIDNSMSTLTLIQSGDI